MNSTTIKESCLIQIEKGALIQIIDDKRKGKILDFIITPNGSSDHSLVCIIYIQLENGNTYSATSDKFEPIDDVLYPEFYPSVHMNKLTNFNK